MGEVHTSDILPVKLQIKEASKLSKFLRWGAVTVWRGRRNSLTQTRERARPQFARLSRSANLVEVQLSRKKTVPISKFRSCVLIGALTSLFGFAHFIHKVSRESHFHLEASKNHTSITH